MYEKLAMQKCWTVAAVALAMLVAGCAAQPQYLVKGLTLPPGSTEKSRKESKVTTSDRKLKFGEQPDGTLLVYFDSTSSWDEVTAHFDKSLQQAGFTPMSNPLASMGGSLAGKLPGGGTLKDMAKGFMDYTRTYTKEGYSVTLTNTKSVMESKVLSKFRKNTDPAPGDYMLLVTKQQGVGAPAKIEVPNR